MSEQLDTTTFTGAHPTARDLVAQLRACRRGIMEGVMVAASWWWRHWCGQGHEQSEYPQADEPEQRPPEV